ncbi:hypothetical protein V8E53_013396, partial [Lactarius tabidus]
HTDCAQQAFSAAKVPTLQLALPVIEQLYTSWEKASSKLQYDSFVPVLNAGMAKLNTYYKCSAESDAHIMAMVLEPSTKMTYFHKHWSSDLVSEVEDTIQARFLEHFNSLQWDPGAKSKPICKSSSRHKSVHHNIDDTDSKDDAGGCEATDALSNRWKDKWKSYLNTNEDVPEGV